MNPRQPVTVVCVYNDADVLAECLQRSVADGRELAPAVEIIAVDNTGHQFASAGAALNHGVRQARHDVVVFAHQDVFLHSLPSLERAAGLLQTGEWDVVGAAGITASSRLAGRIRDRVMLAGEPAVDPIEVDSLDEVLFAATRRLLLEEPLTEAPELAWHAYAVEYGLRIRRRGGRVAAVDIPLTHNSLSTNLARLELAHHTVGTRYPEFLPIRTTCGVIGGSLRPLPRWLDHHRWRYRWLRGSWATFPLHQFRGRRPVVLSDIRETVDQLLAGAESAETLQILNVDATVDPPLASTIELTRFGRSVSMAAADLPTVREQLTADGDGCYLVTNISPRTARELCDLAPGPTLAGFSAGTGAWCVIGAAAGSRPEGYTTAQARPLDLRPAGSRR